MKIYNTLTRQTEEFKSIKKNKVGLYTCGPTVYNYQHIGNMRTYIFEDTLKRVLEYNKYKVNHIMNITDVGHLTDDANEGEDKMEKGSAREGKSAWYIAKFYTKAFKKDLKELNIIKPNKFPRATDHIKEQIDLIKKLEKKGFTYKTNDGIYFDTSKLKDYGKLAQLKKQSLKAGSRVEMGDKKTPTDFALWKFSPENQKRQMEWKSPWGVGFPGWHIECSAMAVKYLGQPFDIHCGGIDHIPVHHTNEIAQSEAVEGRPLANYWMHGEFQIENFIFNRIAIVEVIGKEKEQIKKMGIEIENKENNEEKGIIIVRDIETQQEYIRGVYKNKEKFQYSLSTFINLNYGETKKLEIIINKKNKPGNYNVKVNDLYIKRMETIDFLETNEGIKISKSLENFITLQTLKTRNFNPLAYRYLLLQTHYRKQLSFSWEALQAAQNGLEHLYSFVRGLGKTSTGCPEYETRFFEAVNDDLDMPKALSIMWELIKSPIYQNDFKKKTLFKFDKVLGLGLSKIKKDKSKTPLTIEKLVKERNKARAEKNWSESDELRKQIEALGYTVEDGTDGTKISKK